MKNKLKHNQILLISSQEDLNLLEEILDIGNDSLLIDEDYVAFIEDVLIIMPLSQIDESHQYFGVKPRKMKSWYRKVKS